jgi:ABC-2 type transport system permease protein
MIFHIIRKELKSQFASPMGWLILAMIQAVLGTFYLNGINGYFDMMSGMMRPEERLGITEFVGQRIFGMASILLLFAVPLLSMRLLSEERKQQTLPFLFSAPLSLVEIVLGKFLGLVSFLGILIVFCGLMMLSLNLWSDIDLGYVLANLLGLFLLVASFSALGIYVSSTTSQPVVAAIVTFIVLFALLVLDGLVSAEASGGYAYLSLMRHFEPFSRGMLDSADIAYFGLFILTFLTLTVRRLDADRLRG